MWLFTPIGFFSIVKKGASPDAVQVRARVKADLEALIPFLPEPAELIETPKGDYNWRIEIPHDHWTAALAKLSDEIDYDNFKDAVKERQGWERASAYSSIWSIMAGLQEKETGRRIFGGPLFDASEDEEEEEEDGFFRGDYSEYEDDDEPEGEDPFDPEGDSWERRKERRDEFLAGHPGSQEVLKAKSTLAFNQCHFCGLAYGPEDLVLTGPDSFWCGCYTE